jgi:hypothetical protein
MTSQQTHDRNLWIRILALPATACALAVLTVAGAYGGSMGDSLKGANKDVIAPGGVAAATDEVVAGEAEGVVVQDGKGDVVAEEVEAVEVEGAAPAAGDAAPAAPAGSAPAGAAPAGDMMGTLGGAAKVGAGTAADAAAAGAGMKGAAKKGGAAAVGAALKGGAPPAEGAAGAQPAEKAGAADATGEAAGTEGGD